MVEEEGEGFVGEEEDGEVEWAGLGGFGGWVFAVCGVVVGDCFVFFFVGGWVGRFAWEFFWRVRR